MDSKMLNCKLKIGTLYQTLRHIQSGHSLGYFDPIPNFHYSGYSLKKDDIAMFLGEEVASRKRFRSELWIAQRFLCLDEIKVVMYTAPSTYHSNPFDFLEEINKVNYKHAS